MPLENVLSRPGPSGTHEELYLTLLEVGAKAPAQIPEAAHSRQDLAGARAIGADIAVRLPFGRPAMFATQLGLETGDDRQPDSPPGSIFRLIDCRTVACWST